MLCSNLTVDGNDNGNDAAEQYFCIVEPEEKTAVEDPMV